MSAELPGLRKRARPAPASALAEDLPVAIVTLDASAPHLDTTFDYLVPATWAATAQPGVRVRARFGGKLVDGFVLERIAASEHARVPISRVVDPEAVLTPGTVRLIRAVADRYAGTFADVIRLAVPPRHAGSQHEALPVASALAQPVSSQWPWYRHGDALLERLGTAQPVRAVWTALPAQLGPWPAITQAVAATLATGKRAIVLAPTGRDLGYLETALVAQGIGYGAGGYVRLEASDPVSTRYRSYLAALRGEVSVVIGTRAAVYAPLTDVGLIVVWDDANDNYDEQRAPYPNAAVVASIRAVHDEASLLLGSFSRSAAAQQLVESGWAVALTPSRQTLRERTARVTIMDSSALAAEGPAAGAHLPSPLIRALREESARGPVLVQVPRAGYLPALACQDCFTPARCGICHGPLGREGDEVACRWCGALAVAFTCPACGGHRTRAMAVGQAATLEQIGRTVKDVRMISSSAGSNVKAWVDDDPCIVVATMGAEPFARRGYRLTVLLDAASAARRAGLDAHEEALRRWLTAAALTIPAHAGGRVIAVGDIPTKLANALVAWEPAMFAAADLDERRQLAFPPTVRMAALTGESLLLAEALAELSTEIADLRVLGPVSVPSEDTLLSTTERALVSVPLSASSDLLARLAALAARLSATGKRTGLRIRIDPKELE